MLDPRTTALSGLLADACLHIWEGPKIVCVGGGRISVFPWAKYHSLPPSFQEQGPASVSALFP